MKLFYFKRDFMANFMLYLFFGVCGCVLGACTKQNNRPIPPQDTQGIVNCLRKVEAGAKTFDEAMNELPPASYDSAEPKQHAPVSYYRFLPPRNTLLPLPSREELSKASRVICWPLGDGDVAGLFWKDDNSVHAFQAHIPPPR